MAKMRKLILLVFAVGLFMTSGLFAQTAPAKADPRVAELKLASKLMQRDMPYRVILPEGYATATDTRFPVIYLLHGLFGSSSNWTGMTKLTDYARGYKVIIVTPEGENGWYTDSPTKAPNKYESYIIKELIPEIDAKYRTNARRESRVIAGLSMGGYGAMKFGVKYPEMFALAGSFSGAVGAVTYDIGAGAQTMSAIAKTIGEAYGPAGSDARKANDLFALYRDLTPEKVKALPFIYLDCGTEDFLFQNNRDFLALLIQKKIPHEYRQLPGAHDWKFWDKQIQGFLQLAAEKVK